MMLLVLQTEVISLHIIYTSILTVVFFYRVTQEKVEHFIFILYIMYVTNLWKDNVMCVQYLCH